MSLIRPHIQTWDQPRQIVGGPQADGLAAAWPLAEGGGTAAIDLTGANSGTYIGSPAWSVGPYGPAIALNGTSQYVSIPDSPTLHPPGFTISVRLRTTSLVGMGVAFKVTTSFHGLFLVVNSPGSGGATQDGTIAFYNDRAWVSTNLGAGAVGDGRWHVLTATNYSTIYGGACLYWDGALVATGYGNPTQPTGPLLLGYDLLHNLYFSGALSDARFAGRVLSPAEIQALYTDPLALVRPTLRRTWSVPSGPIYTRPRVMLIA